VKTVTLEKYTKMLHVLKGLVTIKGAD